MEGKGKFVFVNDQNYDLDEAITRLKNLKNKVLVTGLFQPTTADLDILIEMMTIIEELDVPMKMSQEGFA